MAERYQRSTSVVRFNLPEEKKSSGPVILHVNPPSAVVCRGPQGLTKSEDELRRGADVRARLALSEARAAYVSRSNTTTTRSGSVRSFGGAFESESERSPSVRRQVTRKSSSSPKRDSRGSTPGYAMSTASSRRSSVYTPPATPPLTPRGRIPLVSFKKEQSHASQTRLHRNDGTDALSSIESLVQRMSGVRFGKESAQPNQRTNPKGEVLSRNSMTTVSSHQNATNDFVRTPTIAPKWARRLANAEERRGSAERSSSRESRRGSMTTGAERSPQDKRAQSPPRPAALRSPARSSMIREPSVRGLGTRQGSHDAHEQRSSLHQSPIHGRSFISQGGWGGERSSILHISDIVTLPLDDEGHYCERPDHISLIMPPPSVLARAHAHSHSQRRASSASRAESMVKIASDSSTIRRSHSLSSSTKESAFASGLIDTPNMRALATIVVGPSVPIRTSDPFIAFVEAENNRREARAFAIDLLERDQLRRAYQTEGTYGVYRLGANVVGVREEGVSLITDMKEAEQLMPSTTLASSMFLTYQARSFTSYVCFMCGSTVDANALPLHHGQCMLGLNDKLLELRRHPLCGVVAHPVAANAHLLGCAIDLGGAAGLSSLDVTTQRKSIHVSPFWRSGSSARSGWVGDNGFSRVPPSSAPVSERRAYANAAVAAYNSFMVICKGCGEAWPVAEAMEHFEECSDGGNGDDEACADDDAYEWTASRGITCNGLRSTLASEGFAAAAAPPEIAHAVAVTAAAGGGGYRGYPIDQTVHDYMRSTTLPLRACADTSEHEPLDLTMGFINKHRSTFNTIVGGPTRQNDTSAGRAPAVVDSRYMVTRLSKVSDYAQGVGLAGISDFAGREENATGRGGMR